MRAEGNVRGLDNNVLLSNYHALGKNVKTTQAHTHIPTKPYRQEVVTKSYIFKIRFIVIVREVLHNQAIVFSYELKYTIFNIVLKILQDAMQGPKMSI